MSQYTALSKIVETQTRTMEDTSREVLVEHIELRSHQERLTIKHASVEDERNDVPARGFALKRRHGSKARYEAEANSKIDSISAKLFMPYEEIRIHCPVRNGEMEPTKRAGLPEHVFEAFAGIAEVAWLSRINSSLMRLSKKNQKRPLTGEPLHMFVFSFMDSAILGSRLKVLGNGARAVESITSYILEHKYKDGIFSMLKREDIAFIVEHLFISGLVEKNKFAISPTEEILFFALDVGFTKLEIGNNIPLMFYIDPKLLENERALANAQLLIDADDITCAFDSRYYTDFLYMDDDKMVYDNSLYHLPKMMFVRCGMHMLTMTYFGRAYNRDACYTPVNATTYPLAEMLRATKGFAHASKIDKWLMYGIDDFAFRRIERRALDAMKSNGLMALAPDDVKEFLDEVEKIFRLWLHAAAMSQEIVGPNVFDEHGTYKKQGSYQQYFDEKYDEWDM